MSTGGWHCASFLGHHEWQPDGGRSSGCSLYALAEAAWPKLATGSARMALVVLVAGADLFASRLPYAWRLCIAWLAADI